MTQVPLAPPPQTGGPTDGWLYLLWRRLTQAGQILWSSLDFTGSNLTDLATRNHADLQNINTASYTHLTATNHTDLTDAGDSTLHYHASDRDSANFTGANWTDLTDAGDSILHYHAADRLDANQTFTDVTTNNASTTAHGFLLKATAPASGLYNYVGIGNGETDYTNKALFDATVPSTQAFGDAASAGTAAVAARRDHKHEMMAAPTTISGNAGSATYASAITVALDATAASFYPVFVSATTGNLAAKVDGDLTYNPSTNTLTSTTFAGALTGTASGNLTSADIGSTVQAYDADLTTWAGITPGLNVGTFLTTPTLANFNSALSDADVATGGGTATGTNTGDNAVNTLYSGLVTNATHTGDATGSGALTVVAINGTNLAGLATGILKNTTTTGVPSIAVAGDFPTLNQNTTGTASNVTGIVALANGGTGANLVDPAADRIVFWDDSAGVIDWLIAGSGLTITDKTITSTAAASTAKNFVINGGMQVNQRNVLTLGSAAPAANAGYGSVDRFQCWATGTAVSAGTATQDTASGIGKTGYALKLSGVTLTGTGIVFVRHRIEKLNAVKLKNLTTSLSCVVKHDVGSNINYTLTVRKADAEDNFSATTVIQTGSATAVVSATETTLSLVGISMGDCTNGIEIEIKAECGAITTKNFWLTELQLAEGATATTFEHIDFNLELRKCERYFERNISSQYPALVDAVVTDKIYVTHHFRCVKRVTPTVGDFLDGSVRCRGLNRTATASTIADLTITTTSFYFIVSLSTNGLTLGDAAMASIGWTATAEL